MTTLTWKNTMRFKFLNLALLAASLIILTACGESSEGLNSSDFVSIVDDNPLAKGFDFPINPGEMDGWREPPAADQTWDASSYLVHRGDGIHAAIDFMRDDGTSAAGYELWAIADGVVVDIVYDREAYPDRHDGGDRDVGWGNLILIQHDYEENGVHKRVWSQYSHCQTIEVKLNDVVKRNQRIGMVGHTDGKVGVESWNDHLHFELRTTNLKADAWPQSNGLNTDSEVTEYYTHPLKFIRAHRPVI
ncbi:MAG: M23 family metallopeptidase [Gammaproteobacteria bacterium]|nr:M23 family metallopeptidase [Gammaproteobacteria bacterium]